MAVHVRWAQHDDAEVLRRIHRRSSAVWEADRHVLEEHPELVEPTDDAIDARLVRVAVEGDDLLGFTTVIVDGTVAELDALFVDPARIGHRLGRLLVEDAADVARSAGASSVEVTANPNALPFYEHMGFLRTGDAETRFGPAVRMRLDVRS